MLVFARDLTAGTVFEFRGVRYVHIVNIMHEGFNLIDVVCLPRHRYDEGDIRRPVMIRIPRLFQVPVDGLEDVELERMLATQDEIASVNKLVKG